MFQRKALARLNEELSTLAAFDRLHELATVHNPEDTRAHALRHVRRSQITAKIEALKAGKRISAMHHVRVSSGFVLLCAVGYASLRYLLR